MTREKMKKEAEARLEMLDLHPNVLKEFKEENIIYYSEHTPLGGMLYWLHDEPEWMSKIKEVEKEFNILVYHVTHEFTDFGECLTCLYVSSYEEKWEFDRDNLKGNNTKYGKLIYAYVINLNIPEYSKFRSVGIKEVGGGLIRTC